MESPKDFLKKSLNIFQESSEQLLEKILKEFSNDFFGKYHTKMPGRVSEVECLEKFLEECFTEYLDFF